MAYASISDVQARMEHLMTPDEQALCGTLLDDAAVIIDAYNYDAPFDAKQVVSCRMVIRAIGTGEQVTPIGATQGSMSALGYTQSWTIGASGSTGELYLAKLDKKLLGLGEKVGSYSPTQELVWNCCGWWGAR